MIKLTEDEIAVCLVALNCYEEKLNVLSKSTQELNLTEALVTLKTESFLVQSLRQKLYHTI